MECKRCGAELETGLAICSECGARQRRRPKQVRCRHCGKKVSSQLVVCSACGRELKPARLRGWGWLALGLVLVASLALIFSGRLRFDLVAWRQRSADRLRVAASWLAEAPGVVLPTVILPPTPTPTPSPTPTATPTDTPLVTDTPIPSPTPTPSPSLPPTPLYRTYKVQRGDTPAYIASQFGITAEELMAANGITNPSALQVGQELIIPHPPTATATLTPTSLPTATPEPSPGASPTATSQPTATATARSTATPAAVLVAAPTVTLTPTALPTATPTAQPVAAATEARTYTVQSGDSPDSIARRFGITAQALMAANGISDPTRLRVGQELVIPPAGATPPPLPTPTPRPATPTPQPTATPTVVIRFPAPELTSPSDGTPYSDTSVIWLEWNSVGAMAPDEGYVIHVGYVVADEQTEWVHDQFVQETAWRVEAWLHSRAPQESRRYRWYVQVVQVSRDAAGDVLRDDDGKIVGQPVSPESERLTFIWH